MPLTLKPILINIMGHCCSSSCAYNIFLKINFNIMFSYELSKQVLSIKISQQHYAWIFCFPLLSWWKLLYKCWQAWMICFWSYHIEATKMQQLCIQTGVCGKPSRDLKWGSVLYVHAPANLTAWVLDLYWVLMAVCSNRWSECYLTGWQTHR